MQLNGIKKNLELIVKKRICSRKHAASIITSLISEGNKCLAKQQDKIKDELHPLFQS